VWGVSDRCGCCGGVRGWTVDGWGNGWDRGSSGRDVGACGLGGGMEKKKPERERTSMGDSIVLLLGRKYTGKNSARGDQKLRKRGKKGTDFHQHLFAT